MARNWTAEQRAAIDTRKKSLLVSAAAGSGKTATLTQRIIESITDKENPADINRILVVTFTRAAAGELRERISSALKSRLKQEPENRRLERQLLLLPSAKILTIDAFCSDCLKSFPEAAGINPGYRIADEAEMLLLSRDVFDGIAEAALRGELLEKISPEDFDMLTDCLVDSKKMADVFDVFRKAHERLRSTRNGIDTLLPMVEEYNPENFVRPDDTVFGRYIVEREREEFEYRAQLFSSLADELLEDDERSLGYSRVAASDAAAYGRVASAKTYERMRAEIADLNFANLPPAREKTALMDFFFRARKAEKDKIASEGARFFAYSPEMWKSTMQQLYPLMQTFYNTLSVFDEALFARKKSLGMFDYTDIERLTYNALVKNDGSPTELARSISEQYLAVYIDEYQDVNDLQDCIFRAISRPDNRFTVGDIKQSIYSFRSANPDIFAAAKRSYPTLDENPDAPMASIFMSKNFRSSEGVINFVNSIFDKMFGAFAKSIDYSPADRLVAGRDPLGPSFTEKPQICLTPSGEIFFLADEDEIVENEAAEKIAPAVVAAKIKQILDTGTREDGSPVRPCDIAVILRSLKGKADIYTSALERLGIKVKTAGKKSFLLNSDVLLALCLFNSIDNPLRDVYLTGLLCSPLFGFSADELVKIRGGDKHRPFYKSLVDFCDAHPEFEKGRHFLTTLDRWRENAAGQRTDRLIASLFRETGMLALADRCGEKDNLLRLYEYARSFEGSAFGGLRSFISYINNVIADGGRFESNVGCADDDAVTVISAHSSKGLEFPIVFLADAGKKITNLDTKERFLLSIGFGASLCHRTPHGLALVENPMMNAVKERMKDLNLEEELRILYVALTRARERLYVVGAVSGDFEEYLEKLELHSRLCSPAAVRRLSSHLDVIISASGYTPQPPETFVPDSAVVTALLAEMKKDEQREENDENLDTGMGIVEEALEEAEECEVAQTCDIDRELEEELFHRFTYKYHSPHLQALPEKMSVSALYPTVLDGASEVSEPTEIREKGSRTTPEFITPSGEQLSKKRGIATHVFLQFCDFEALAVGGAEKELKRLVEESFMSKTEAELVRLDEVEAFSHSDLIEKMRRAKALYREFRFNTPLPASLFTEDKERQAEFSDRCVLVQGVMDCIMENPDGSLSLVDYKTDRLSAEELSDKALAEKRMRESYENQLYYYCLAAERIFGKRPVSAEVYSLHLGDTLSVMKS